MESLHRQTRTPDQIVVVIDHNRALYERARLDLPAPVVVVENMGPRGLSGARNRGIAVSTGDVVAFLDDDAVAADDWLAQLLVPYANDDVVGVGGLVRPRFDAGRPDWFPPEFDWVVGCTYTGHRRAEGPVRNLIGANMSFCRETLVALGGFRDGIGRVGTTPTGCEETELCIRARQRDPNAVIWYAPAARVEHRVPGVRTTWRYFSARCLAEGRSKARIARVVGHEDALASERTYVTRTLPRASARDVRDGRWVRAGSRVAGAFLTATGYAAERTRERETVAFEPRLVADVDLSDAGVRLNDVDTDTGRRYTRARVLVRHEGRPATVVDVELPSGGLRGADLRERLWPHVPSLPDAPLPDAPSPLPSATVVIATRERPAALGRCIESLLAMEYPDFDIVVVDNAPATTDTEELVGKLHAALGDRIRYVREDQPGLAVAHNKGLEDVTGEIVAFTDDDVVVDGDWLRMLASGFTDARVGCVTGLIAPLELETQVQLWIEDATGFGKGMARREFEPDKGPDDDPLYPFAAGCFGSGANMAFRTDALRAMGGFDPALGAGTIARGGDDLNAFARVVLHGHRLVYEPAAIVWHMHRRDLGGLRRQAFGYGAGLTAYLTSIVVEKPARLPELARRAPGGLRYALAPSSPKNARVPSSQPRDLRYRELAGMALGPLLYTASRRSAKAR